VLIPAAWRGAALVLGLLLASGACAHDTPFSYLTLTLQDSGVRGALIVHEFDAAHELGIADPATLRDPAVARLQELPLRRIVASRLHIAVDGQPSQPVWGPLEVLPDRQSLRLGFTLPQLRPATVALDARLFPYDPVHQTFVDVYEGERLRLQGILDMRDPALVYYAGSLQGRWAVVRSFVQSGVHHILIGWDHILFLLGLLLLGGSLWRLASIVTAFTAGHTVTLSLAALEIVQLPPSLIEPAIALSIVLVGVDNLLMQRERRPSNDDAGEVAAARDLRPWLAGAFGLIHGFGFAAVLTEVGLPRDALGWSLAAFNAGVEVGQLLIVLPTATLLWWLWRYSPRGAARTVFTGSLVVIAAGLYWFLQRLGFIPG
jgi:hydrogenase/urease accessory protein HupE